MLVFIKQCVHCVSVNLTSYCNSSFQLHQVYFLDDCLYFWKIFSRRMGSNYYLICFYAFCVISVLQPVFQTIQLDYLPKELFFTQGRFIVLLLWQVPPACMLQQRKFYLFQNFILEWCHNVITLVRRCHCHIFVTSNRCAHSILIKSLSCFVMSS